MFRLLFRPGTKLKELCCKTLLRNNSIIAITVSNFSSLSIKGCENVLPPLKLASSSASFRYPHIVGKRSALTAADIHLIRKRKNRTVLMYIGAAAISSIALAYAAVPLYRLYCQASGYGGTTKKIENVGEVLQSMEKVEDRELTVKFSGDTSGNLQWKFRPQQPEVKIAPGETVLAFYTAENLTDTPIIGISTYNVIPFDAGQYFNKVQCFCFEEQRLNPNEQVDMPVFFYIDPEFNDDPLMAKVDTITLSYTFFEAKEYGAPQQIGH